LVLESISVPSLDDDQSLETLVRFLDVHRGHFALGFVRINSPSQRTRILHQLQAARPCDKDLQVIDLEDHAPSAPIEVIERKLAGLDKGAPVCLIGIDSAVLEGGLARELNLSRELLPKLLRAPLLLWVSDAAADRILEDAPDFADWHNMTFRFVRESSFPFEMAQGIIEPSQAPRLSREYYEQRVRILEKLLAEQSAQQQQGAVDRARRLIELGNAQTSLGRSTEAVRSFSHAIDLVAKEPADRLVEVAEIIGVARMNIGQAMSQAGFEKDAMEYLEKALPILMSLDARGNVGAARNIAVLQAHRAMLLWMSGRNNEATESARESVGIWRRLRNSGLPQADPMFVKSLAQLAGFHSDAGLWDEAERVFDEAFSVAKDLTLDLYSSGSDAEALLYLNFGVHLSATGDDFRALSMFGRAMTLYSNLIDAGRAEFEPMLVKALMNLGVSLARQGLSTRALENFRAALEILEARLRSRLAVSPEELILVLKNLASALADSGDASAAKQQFERALGLARSADGALSVRAEIYAEILDSLASLESQSGDLWSGIRWLERAVAEKSDLPPNWIHRLWAKLGVAYTAVADWTRAARAFREAIEALQSLPVSPPNHILTLADLHLRYGQALMESGDGVQGTNQLRSAVAILKDLVSQGADSQITEVHWANALFTKAEILAKAGHDREARNDIAAALKAFDKLVKSGVPPSATQIEPARRLKKVLQP
jgi:tetratricopeptide (TPR) repeat protein